MLILILNPSGMEFDALLVFTLGFATFILRPYFEVYIQISSEIVLFEHFHWNELHRIHVLS